MIIEQPAQQQPQVQQITAPPPVVMEMQPAQQPFSPPSAVPIVQTYAQPQPVQQAAVAASPQVASEPNSDNVQPRVQPPKSGIMIT